MPHFEDDQHGDGKVLTKTRTKARLARPRLYKVLLHNDDFTPREFVVIVLRQVFHMTESDASRLMLYVHQNGVGVVGLYPFSVAETKVAEVGSLARQAEVPLLCTIEADEGGESGDGSGPEGGGAGDGRGPDDGSAPGDGSGDPDGPDRDDVN